LREAVVQRKKKRIFFRDETEREREQKIGVERRAARRATTGALSWGFRWRASDWRPRGGR